MLIAVVGIYSFCLCYLCSNILKFNIQLKSRQHNSGRLVVGFVLVAPDKVNTNFAR